MAMRGCSIIPKSTTLLGPLHQIVYRHIWDICWGVLPLYRCAVGVFYRPSRLGNPIKIGMVIFRPYTSIIKAMQHFLLHLKTVNESIYIYTRMSVCMYVCVGVYYVNTKKKLVCLFIPLSIYEYILRVYIYIYIYIYWKVNSFFVFMKIYAYAHTHTHTQTDRHICIYIYIYIYTCVCMYNILSIHTRLFIFCFPLKIDQDWWSVISALRQTKPRFQ